MNLVLLNAECEVRHEFWGPEISGLSSDGINELLHDLAKKGLEENEKSSKEEIKK